MTKNGFVVEVTFKPDLIDFYGVSSTHQMQDWHCKENS